MVRYILTSKKRNKLRDEIDDLLGKRKEKRKIWGNVNSLIADAYYRAKK